MGMKHLNRIYEWGTPTYEILVKKRSIIDVAITKCLSTVRNFEVKPDLPGANVQPCHKIIQLTLRTKVSHENNTTEASK